MADYPDNRLVLYPRAIGARVSLPALLKTLLEIGLIGDQIPPARVNGMDGHYLTGSRFFEHISFVGCSPNLKLEPPEEGEQDITEFCHIGLDCGDEVRFLGGDNVRSPQCTQCKTVVDDWQASMPRWRKAPEVFTHQCSKCGATKPLQMFNWRRTAGFAAVSIHIWGVHQSEAVPNSALLSTLEALTRCPWEYFYRVGHST